MKKYSIITFLFILTLIQVQGASLVAESALTRNNLKLHSHLYAKKVSPFKISNVRARFELNLDWGIGDSTELTKSINSILSQPFTWLAHGYQTYAFLSKDGKYVLKFFQTQYSKSFKYIQQNFNGTKLAFDELPQESGIVFVHINRTENLLNTFQVYDSEGKRYDVKGDDVCFFIQTRADYVIPTIESLMENGNLALAKRRIDHIFDLICKLTKKKIADNDRILIENNNVGFVENNAIYIDCGHLVKDQNLDGKKRMHYEFKNRLNPLFTWLQQNYPELAKYYKKRELEILAKF